MHIAKHCTFNCKLHLILAILGLSRASAGAPLAALCRRRALQIRGFLLQIAIQHAHCKALHFQLQAAPDSGGFEPVSGLSWGLLRGFWQGPCPADSQLLLPSLGQDTLCTRVRFKLQAEPDSGYLGPVLRVSLRALFWGSWQLLSPADSQISAAKPCIRCALHRPTVCLL